MKIRHFFSLLTISSALCFTAVTAVAQVEVDQTMTIEELVNEIILGEGVDAFNITYNGMPGDSLVTLQTGSFSASGITFPIEEGLIMATADSRIMEPNGPAGIIDNLQNDPDLMVLAGQPVFNCAIIEFDFTVESDSVIFDYIFASSEYTQYTCCDFNDVFGFFLSGPGITGPFTSPAEFPDGSINIALIPGTETQVGVNSVNGGEPTGGCPSSGENCLEANPNYVEDSQYFINNAGPGAAGPSGISSTLNGHTTLLTARSPIQCGETYHIKLGIANAFDTGFQSAVFLRKGSFSAAGEVFVTVSPSLPGVNLEGTGFENVVVAGCFSPLVELVRPEGAPVGNITVSYGGTATEGVDYELGEGDTLFSFGEDIDTLFFNVTTFPNPDAPDTLFIDFFVTYIACDDTVTLTASLPIIQPYEYGSETENVDVFCPADSTVVTAQGVDGVGPYNYNWVGEGPGQSVFVPVPPEALWYLVEITDQCEFDTVLDSVLVTNLIPPALSLEIPQTVEPLCPRMPVTIDAFASDGNGEYFYAWDPQPSGTDTVPSSITVEFPETQMVYLTVTDTCGTQVTDSVQVFYPEYDDIEVALDLDRRTCPESALRLRADVSGGAGEYNIVWSEEDQRGRFETPEEAETVYEPDPGLTLLRVDVLDQCFVMGFAGPYLGIVDVQDTLRTIDLAKIPNVITPNGDGRNDYFAVPGLDIFPGTHLQVWDRWGAEVFESDNYTAVMQQTGRPSNAFGGEDRPDGSYFFVLNVNSGECVKTGYVDIVGSNEPRVRR